MPNLNGSLLTWVPIYFCNEGCTQSYSSLAGKIRLCCQAWTWKNQQPFTWELGSHLTMIQHHVSQKNSLLLRKLEGGNSILLALTSRKEVALLAQDQSISRELCRKSRKGISNIYSIQQLTVEQHGLEMQRFTYTQISFTKDIPGY